MRGFLVFLVCIGALAAGAGLGYVCVERPMDAMRAWDVGNTMVTGVVPQATGTPNTPGWHNGVWTPPHLGDLPAMPNMTWTMKSGKTYENVVITGIDSTEVTITHSLGVAHFKLDSLPHDIQHQLQYEPENGTPDTSAPASTPAPTNSSASAPPAPAAASAPTPASATASASAIAAMVDNKLIDSHGQPVATPGAGIKYYAIYYSAGSVPECRTFTPTLVNWYRTFKPAHPNFELIFVSEDRSESDMTGFMQEMQMPWPAVKYSELPRTNGTFHGPGIQQFASTGIPDLVLVDATGKVLADSFNGATYAGPQSVVDYISANVSAN